MADNSWAWLPESGNGRWGDSTAVWTGEEVLIWGGHQVNDNGGMTGSGVGLRLRPAEA